MGQTRSVLGERERAYLYDLVLHRAGIRLQPQQRSQIDWAVSVRRNLLSGISLSEYFARLQEEDEFLCLVDLLTVQETYFFRYAGQFDALKTILKELITKASLIRVWSAGCATGEEPYSIAIAASEALGSEVARVRIMASDISRTALKKAAEAIYPRRAVREVSPDLLSRYFVKSERGYQLQEAIRHRVHFFHHNLQKDPVPQALWIIFCRNVTIYFPKEVTCSVIEKFRQALMPGGILFTGHAESLFGLSLGFVPKVFPACFVYCKEETGSLPPPRPQVPPPSSPPLPPSPPLSKKRGEGPDLSAGESSLPAHSPQAGAQAGRLSLEDLQQAPSAASRVALFEARGGLTRRSVQQEEVGYALLKLVGEAYADLGDREKAIELLEWALERNSLDWELHYLLSLLYEQRGALPEALRVARSAVYLNPSVEVYFQLAKVLEALEDYAAASQAYRNALVALWEKKEGKSELEDLLLTKLSKLRRKER